MKTYGECDGTCTQILSDLIIAERKIKELEASVARHQEWLQQKSNEKVQAIHQLEEARFHLGEFTDRTIAAETKVGDLRMVLRNLIRRIEDDALVAVIKTALEDTE